MDHALMLSIEALLIQLISEGLTASGKKSILSADSAEQFLWETLSEEKFNIFATTWVSISHNSSDYALRGALKEQLYDKESCQMGPKSWQIINAWKE